MDGPDSIDLDEEHTLRLAHQELDDAEVQSTSKAAERSFFDTTSKDKHLPATQTGEWTRSSPEVLPSKASSDGSIHPDSSRASSSSAKRDRKKKPTALPLNSTVVFGSNVTDAIRAAFEQQSVDTSQRTTLEQLAGGKLQTSFKDKKKTKEPILDLPVQTSKGNHTQAFTRPSDWDKTVSANALDSSSNSFTSSKKKSPLNQTMAIEDIAAQMAEFAKISASEHSDAVQHKAIAVEANEIQQWIQEVGTEPEGAHSAKIDDPSALEAQAERAIAQEDIDRAVELYLRLLRSDPQKLRYQNRLEDLWIQMRERAVHTAGEVESIAFVSSLERRKIHLLWGGGMGSVMLLLCLLFVWPGWMRTHDQHDAPAQRGQMVLSTIQMNSTPAGATVWINGVDTGKSTPFSMEKKPGTYEVSLKMSGYRTLRKNIRLKKGQFFAIEFALAPKRTVRRRYSRRTKVRKQKVERRYRVRRKVQKRKRPVVVQRDVQESPKIAFSLRSNPPGARIFMQERDTGKRTPATFSLKQGRYLFQLELKGHQTYVREIPVSKRIRRFDVRLLRTVVSLPKLVILSKPSGALIRIDGKDTQKKTPATIEVQPGKHTLELLHKGYAALKKTFSLRGGETRRIQLQLTKKKASSSPMVYVAGGGFWMGNNAGISREKPMRRVSLSSFWIDRYEVTVEAYQACVAAGKCKKRTLRSGCNSGEAKARHPVNCVRWYDARAYCRWKKKRLPTEAQWEKAARGSSTQLYPWGHTSPSCRYTIFNRQCGSGTSLVGSRKRGRSPYGVYDMAGNVWEWTRDYFDRSFYHKAGDRNPYNTHRGSGYKVIRGGAWNTPSGNLHLTYRLEYWPARSSSSIGFRCVR